MQSMKHMKLKALLEYRSTALWLVAHDQSRVGADGAAEIRRGRGDSNTLGVQSTIAAGWRPSRALSFTCLDRRYLKGGLQQATKYSTHAIRTVEPTVSSLRSACYQHTEVMKRKEPLNCSFYRATVSIASNLQRRRRPPLCYGTLSENTKQQSGSGPGKRITRHEGCNFVEKTSYAPDDLG